MGGGGDGGPSTPVGGAVGGAANPDVIAGKGDLENMGDICALSPFLRLFYGRFYNIPLEPETGLPPTQADAMPPKTMILTADMVEHGLNLKFLVKEPMFGLEGDFHGITIRVLKTPADKMDSPAYCNDITLDGLKTDEKGEKYNAEIKGLAINEGDIVWIYYDRKLTYQGTEYPMTECSVLLKDKKAYEDFLHNYCVGVLGAFQYKALPIPDPMRSRD